MSVYQARVNMGRELAREHPVEADMVCGVPDSGLDAASGFALESHIPLSSGFTKNRYIGRSFIFPTQTQRDNAVRLKLNPLKANIKGKRLVVVDDSIVRGTTSARTVKMLRDAGAAEIHMRISSPPFTHACHFGTDIDSEEKLIANKMPLERIAAYIGADTLGYISLEGCKRACYGTGLGLCSGCFDGNYPMDVGHHKKTEFEC
ncbi:Amidophosphoribosyltransferase [bioreactor metagenome]|uniref:Amidophosphoribosyltransferase n=1 Tax=bioreactor metagenome TaxID=1076179 RepID=A0A645HNG1_9ZZZZ